MPIIWTKKAKRAMKKLAAVLARDTFDVTAENAGYRQTLDNAWDDGKIGVITTSIDCDCTRGYYERVVEMPNCVAAIKRHANDFYDNLEGPGSMRFVHWSSIDRSRSNTRDLALEAFEDGHPHVVYA